MSFDLDIAQIAINDYHHSLDEIIDLIGNGAWTFRLRARRRFVIAHEPVDVLTDAPVNLLVGHILFAAPRLRDAMAGKPFVVWQLEPLSDANWLIRENPEYIDLLRKAVRVWDYSRANIATLAEWGITNTALIPFGYHKCQETVPRGRPKDIDVCFFGCITGRRKHLIDALSAAGVVVAAREKCYGEERDELIARSRIALNVHGFDGVSILEEARLSFLLANRCFVVSEVSDHNPYGDGVVLAPYDGLVAACRHWLAQPEEARAKVAEAGHAALRAVPFLDSLASAYRDARQAIQQASVTV